LTGSSKNAFVTIISLEVAFGKTGKQSQIWQNAENGAKTSEAKVNIAGANHHADVK
jgi:hypothetical protein